MKRWALAGVVAVCAAAAALVGASRPAGAHEFRPCFLDIKGVGGGRYRVHWNAGGSPEGAPGPLPVLPAHCRGVEVGGDVLAPLVDCGEAGLEGSTITIQGLSEARVDAVVRFSGADGVVTTRVLREGAPTFTVPGAMEAPRSRLDLAAGYLRAGVEHIAGGLDHLLFVLGLLLLVERLRPLLLTVTAFTAAHSVTLALAATGAVHVPQAPAEALIALSLMLLAAEIARPAEEAEAARRRPWVMAFAFGLLHGFGFAGALIEIGVPAGEVPLSLFAFNVGVECGQLAVVGAALGVAWVVRRVARPTDAAATWMKRAPAYAVGALSAMWFFERLAKLGE